MELNSDERKKERQLIHCVKHTTCRWARSRAIVDAIFSSFAVVQTEKQIHRPSCCCTAQLCLFFCLFKPDAPPNFSHFLHHYSLQILHLKLIFPSLFQPPLPCYPLHQTKVRTWHLKLFFFFFSFLHFLFAPNFFCND